MRPGTTSLKKYGVKIDPKLHREVLDRYLTFST